MWEPILRAIASLIIITGLILWLGKSASSGGVVSRFVAKANGPALGTKPGTAKRPKLRGLAAQFSASGWGRKEPAAPVMTVAARQMLLGRTGVAVVDIDGHRLVLGVSDSQVSLITTLATPQEDTEPAQDSKSLGLSDPDNEFAKMLVDSLNQQS